MKSRIFPGLLIIFSVISFSCSARLDFEQRRFSNRFYSRVEGQVQTLNEPVQENFSMKKAEEKAEAKVLSGFSVHESGSPVQLDGLVQSPADQFNEGQDSAKKRKGRREDNFRYDPDRSSPDMEKKDSKLAIFSLVAGVLTFASMFIMFYGVLLFGLTSLVLVLLARRRMKMKPETTGGYGLTVAALLLVTVAFLISGWLVISFYTN